MYVVLPGGTVVKNLPASVGNKRDVGSIPGSGRSPGGRHGNPLQYSCLKNSMDRWAWQVTVHGVTKTQTWLNTHMGSLPRGNIHGLLNAAKFSNGTIVNLIKYRLKNIFKFYIH